MNKHIFFHYRISNYHSSIFTSFQRTILILLVFFLFLCASILYQNKLVFAENNSPKNANSLNKSSYDTTIDMQSTHYYYFRGKPSKTTTIHIFADITPSFSFQVYSEQGDIIPIKTYYFSKEKNHLSISYKLPNNAWYFFSLKNLLGKTIPYSIYTEQIKNQKTIPTNKKNFLPKKRDSSSKKSSCSKKISTSGNSISSSKRSDRSSKKSSSLKKSSSSGNPVSSSKHSDRSSNKSSSSKKGRSSSRKSSNVIDSSPVYKEIMYSFSLSQNLLFLKTGQSYKLSVQKNPRNYEKKFKKIKWYSSDSTVVGVSSGICRSFRKGIAVITCTVEIGNKQYSASCSVRVTD